MSPWTVPIQTFLCNSFEHKSVYFIVIFDATRSILGRQKEKLRPVSMKRILQKVNAVYVGSMFIHPYHLEDELLNPWKIPVIYWISLKINTKSHTHEQWGLYPVICKVNQLLLYIKRLDFNLAQLYMKSWYYDTIFTYSVYDIYVWDHHRYKIICN